MQFNLTKAMRKARKAYDACVDAGRPMTEWTHPEYLAFQDGAQFYDCETHELIAEYPQAMQGFEPDSLEGAQAARRMFLADHAGFYGMGEPRELPTFVIDGAPCDLGEALRANADDGAFCDWARTAQVGESFPAFVSCTRVW